MEDTTVGWCLKIDDSVKLAIRTQDANIKSTTTVQNGVGIILGHYQQPSVDSPSMLITGLSRLFQRAHRQWVAADPATRKKVWNSDLGDTKPVIYVYSYACCKYRTSILKAADKHAHVHVRIDMWHLFQRLRRVNIRNPIYMVSHRFITAATFEKQSDDKENHRESSG